VFVFESLFFLRYITNTPSMTGANLALYTLPKFTVFVLYHLPFYLSTEEVNLNLFLSITGPFALMQLLIFNYYYPEALYGAGNVPERLFPTSKLACYFNSNFWFRLQHFIMYFLFTSFMLTQILENEKVGAPAKK